MNKSKTSVIPYASGHTRAQWLTFLMVVCIVLNLIAVGSYCAQIGLLSEVAAGHWVAPARIAANSRWQEGVAGSQMLAFLITAIVFLMWIHRAHRNLPALGARTLRYSPGWAVGGFFVPFLNLVRPYQVVKEIWKASDPDSTDGSSWQNTATSPLIGWWWAFWIISSFVGNIAGRMGFNPKTDLLALNWAWLVSDLTGILAGILAILVVRGIDARQEEKSRRPIMIKTPHSGPDMNKGGNPMNEGLADENHSTTSGVARNNPSTPNNDVDDPATSKRIRIVSTKEGEASEEKKEINALGPEFEAPWHDQYDFGPNLVMAKGENEKGQDNSVPIKKETTSRKRFIAREVILLVTLCSLTAGAIVFSLCVPVGQDVYHSYTVNDWIGPPNQYGVPTPVPRLVEYWTPGTVGNMYGEDTAILGPITVAFLLYASIWFIRMMRWAWKNK